MSLVVPCIVLTGNLSPARLVTDICIMLYVAVVVRRFAMPNVMVATVVVDIWSTASVMVVPSRVVAPVPWRVPAYISRSPPIVEYVRTYCVCRNNHIVRTVDIRIANYCDCSRFRAATFDEECSNILEQVVAEDCLKQYIVLALLCDFDNTQIINISIAVEIKIGKRSARVVEDLLKILDGIRFAESSGYGFKVEIVRNLVCLGCNGDSLCLLSEEVHCQRYGHNGHQKS